MEFWIALKALVGEKFHHLVEGKCSLYVTFRAGSLNGVVGSFSDTIKEPINSLFFCGRVERVVVGHLRDEFFEEVDMLGNVCSIYVT